MVTLKTLIQSGFFEKDANGFSLVPIVGWDDIQAGPARICATEAPGLYPLVGVGPGGYATQYCEAGTIRPDFAPDPFHDVMLTNAEVRSNSLAMPNYTESVAYLVVTEDDEVLGAFDTRDEADLYSVTCNGEQVIKNTLTRVEREGCIAFYAETEIVGMGEALPQIDLSRYAR